MNTMDRERLRELLNQHTLQPNHALSSLPPLPQTPHHSRHAPSIYDSEDEAHRYEPRSQRRRGPEREYPSTAARRQHSGSSNKLSDIDAVSTLGRLPRSATLPSLNHEMPTQRGKSRFETVYPMLSTRQSSLNTARNTSPTKLDFLSPTRQPSDLLHPSSATKLPPSKSFTSNRQVSASFMLPQGADMSMLQDVTFGDLARVSLGNETLDIGMLKMGDESRAGASLMLPHATAGKVGEVSSARPIQADPLRSETEGVSPITQPASTVKCFNRPPLRDLDIEDLHPITPSRYTSTERPSSRKEVNITNLTTCTTIPSPPLETRPIPQSVRRTDSVRRPRIPPSSSSNFLALPAMDHAGDMSTFLPVSPLKTRHLMSDEHLLTHTKMDDETMLDMSLIMPPRLSPAKTPHRSHTAMPTRTPRSAKSRNEPAAEDMTMDIQQMMAKVNKPKLGLGAEESVLDLFRADMDDDEMDTSMGDSFLPPDLRPRLVRSKSLSRLELEKRSALQMGPASPTRTLPRVRPTSFAPIAARSQVSPSRMPPVAMPSAITSRRVSLSVGALPLPASACLRKLALPARRIVSPAKPSQPVPAPAVSTRTSARPMPPPARVTKTSMPPPLTSTSRNPQPPKSRLGSTVSTISVNATSRTSTLPRPTSSRPLPKSTLPEVPTTRISTATRPSTRPPTLPQPGSGTSARSATMPRSFGNDATGVSNRLPRPATASTTSTRLVKGSMGPPSGLVARPPISAPTALKSRTLSTPATTLTRPSTTQTLPISTTARAPTSRSSTLPSATRAPSANIASSARLPHPPATGTVRRTGSSHPSIAHPTGSIGKPSSSSATTSKSATVAGLADIRARLDRLQARHQTSRPVR